jgi:predicted SprT family Zn-dependent metalloprotease
MSSIDLDTRVRVGVVAHSTTPSVQTLPKELKCTRARPNRDIEDSNSVHYFTFITCIMARLRRKSPVANDSDEELGATTQTTSTNARLRTSPRKRTQKSYTDSDFFKDNSDKSDYEDASTLVAKVPTGSVPKTRQIKLAPLKASGSSNELQQRVFSPERTRRRPLKDLGADLPKFALPTSNPFASIPSLAPPAAAQDEQEEADLEESVWCGSDAGTSGSGSESEDDLPSVRKLWPGKRMNTAAPKAASNSLDEALQGFQGLSIKEKKPEETKPARMKPAKTKPQTMRPAKSKPANSQESALPAQSEPLSDERPNSSHDKNDLDAAILRFSPPRLVSSSRELTPERPTTPPPASPTKARLVSPSKAKTRIPTPPLRQSLDAFWSPNQVNDWNDKHSPRKTIKSPKKNPFLPEEANKSSTTSPTSSPKKSQSSSPTKRSRSDLQTKKDFATRKHALASAFLLELDSAITSGQIAALSASTGGVQLIWSKTLNSTAGRANWRRETTRTTTRPASPSAEPITTTAYKHHASIELAEKVIDDESRLLNVLAHEFCHLANFMVSGIKDQPHGASFKAWGAKCTSLFADRGVEVTTKHSYAIDYKYVWRCEGEGCWAEFKRHSKSIDPKRQTCGSCRSKLVQIKPVPRGGGSAVAAGGAVAGYAGFVKAHFADVKKSLPVGSSQKEVMEALGRKYREEKEQRAAEATTSRSGVEDLTRALDVVVLDD